MWNQLFCTFVTTNPGKTKIFFVYIVEKVCRHFYDPGLIVQVGTALFCNFCIFMNSLYFETGILFLSTQNLKLNELLLSAILILCESLSQQ